MKVWIDQDLCTGDGLCEEIAPDVFTLLDDGLAYVREKDKIFATAKGNAQGAEGMANFEDKMMDAVIESAEECPGECIFIEPSPLNYSANTELAPINRATVKNAVCATILWSGRTAMPSMCQVR